MQGYPTDLRPWCAAAAAHALDLVHAPMLRCACFFTLLRLLYLPPICRSNPWAYITQALAVNEFTGSSWK